MTDIPDAEVRWRGAPLTMGRLGQVLLAHWLLIVACALVGVVGGVVATRLVAPVYSSTATLLVKAIPSASSVATYEGAQYAAARAKAYPTLITNPTVLQGVRTDTRSSESVVDIRKDLTATTVVDTPLVQVTARGATPQVARDKANSAARQLARLIPELETVGGKSPVSVEVAVAAGAPQKPISPRRLLYVAAGLILGMALGIAISLLHEYVGGTRRARPTPQRRGRSERHRPGGPSGSPEAGDTEVNDSDSRPTSADQRDSVPADEAPKEPVVR